MRTSRKNFWLTASLVNLCIVALLGFTLRSKILFSTPWLDYRNVLSAHSHFAFGGWAGLCLMTFLIYDLLPDIISQKRIYQWILAGIEISSLGMAILFPIHGYTTVTIFFSSLYIFASFVFAAVFFKDIFQYAADSNIKLLSLAAVSSLVISAAGPLGLLYIIVSKTGDSILYRDSIYTFLHFQYNGFFTLSVLAILFNYFFKKGIHLNEYASSFSWLIILSIVPSLFLALLWHNKLLFYFLAATGSIFILLSLLYFFATLYPLRKRVVDKYPLSNKLLAISIFSFVMKMLLQVGTIFPKLGNAVYGDRAIIIGFLHLVFLGFVSLYLLSHLISSGYFIRKGKLSKLPFVVFTSGVIINEALLMVQGLSILFKFNSSVYQWLLWVTSIVLFSGSFLILLSKLFADKNRPGAFKI